MRNNIVKELYQRSEQRIAELEQQNSILSDSIALIYRYSDLDTLIYYEAEILFPQIDELSLGYLWSIDKKFATHSSFAQIEIGLPIGEKQKETMRQWLRKRCNDKDMRIEIIQRY